jgi:hypothetical protein
VLEPLVFKIYLILDDAQNPANTVSKPDQLAHHASTYLLAPAKHCVEPCKHCVKTVPVSKSPCSPLRNTAQNLANTASKPDPLAHPASTYLLAPAKHCAEPCKHCVKTVPVSKSPCSPLRNTAQNTANTASKPSLLAHSH